ncbi:MAG: hypothetical protein N3J91_02265 [Verrucomicrobiae bacterium]|nr:hypothetical protein [Verrucomicrobiae bacterium]
MHGAQIFFQRGRFSQVGLVLVAGLLPAWGQEEPVVRPLPAARILQAAAEVIASSAAKPAAATNAPAAKAPVDILEFNSGDTLRGRFLGWSAAGGIRWQHEGVEGELKIIPDKVRKFRLHRPPQSAPQTMRARLWLHNGDRLSVNLVEMDAQKAVVDSWYAGRLEPPRAAISNLTLFFSSGDLIYHGPAGLEGWQQSGPMRLGAAAMVRNELVIVDGEVVVAREQRGDEDSSPAWVFTGDVLEAVRPGALGRDFKLPRQSSVSMELEAPNTPAFTLHLYADAVDKFTGINALSFTFSGRMIYFRRSLGNGGSRQIGNVDHQKFGAGVPTRVKLTVCTDLDQQVVAVYLDDLLIRKFSIAGQVEGLGTGLVIQQQAATSLKISNLTISRWNGVLDETPATPVAGREDLLLLNNRDKLSGQLLSLSEGKLWFQTAYSKIEIPLERIQRIALVPPAGAQPAAGRQPRVLLGDAGRLTLQIQRWDEQVIEGISPVLGAVKLNARAVIGMQYE